MRYFELFIPVQMKKDLKYEDMNIELSKTINYMMLQNELLSFIHKDVPHYKFYVYTGLRKFTKNVSNMGYKKGETSYFHLRALLSDVAYSFRHTFLRCENDLFKVLKVDVREHHYNPQNSLKELQTITPAIAVFTDERVWYWTAYRYSVQAIIERINRNTIKKFNKSHGENVPLDHSFVKDLQLRNSIYGIKIKYKTPEHYDKPKYFYTNHFNIKVNEDELSQKLAWFATGVGLLEKNAFGLGFCEIKA